MRGLFAAAIVAGLVVGGAVTGFRVVAKDSSPAAGESAPPPSAGSPAVTAQAFAAAWSSGAFANLYPLLDAESRRAYPQAVFLETYAAFVRDVTVDRAAVSVAATSESGATLGVRLSTAYFGEIEYTTTIAFTRTGNDFFVRWEPSTVHPEMGAGRVFKSTIERPARGAILDRNGAALAVTRDVRMLGLNRSVVRDRAALTAGVVERLGFTKEQVDQAFASRAGQNQRVPVGPVPDDLSAAASELLRMAPGIMLYFETQRVHPLGPAAAHVVGYTRELTADELAARAGQGFRVGDRVGATGLEASMEDALAGRIGAELRVVDQSGATVRVAASREFVQGKDLQTTLDGAVLRKAYERLGGRAGAVVVLDPRTNAVLALNSSPSFDPDAFERNDAAALAAITAAPGGPQANRATTGLYSAGSAFKLITGAAGMLYGGYNPRDQFYCGSVWSGIDPPRKNWEGAQGPLTIALGLMRSCNPVFYEIGLTLYNATDGALSRTARAFGFGAATGIVGLSEEDGLVPDAAWKRQKRNEPWYPGDEVNLAIGQGDLLITPIQMANAYSAFLNNELRAPVIIAGETATSRGKIGLTAEQHAHLRLGLELVTSATGTANAAFALAGYTNFGGKSGTAEDADAQQHVLFIAYSPKSAPQAVAAVFLDEGKSGSIEAGPIARDVILAALR